MKSAVSTSVQYDFFKSQLPESIRLRSGAIFHPAQEHWKFRDGIYTVYMNFSDLPHQVSPILPYAKQVLLNFLEINSPTHAVNMFRSFVRLADVIALTAKDEVLEVSQAHILNFVAKHKSRPGIDAHLSALITRWSELGMPGLSADAVELLASMRKKGNRKGHAVQTLDPVEGPFTEFEVQQLTQALNLAYAEGTFDPMFYFLTWLAMLTGQRVSQYCALKVQDLAATTDSDGNVAYEISIPKAKQRGSVVRDTFHVRPLLRQFGEQFWAYAQSIEARFPELGIEAPMFPATFDSDLQQLDAGFEKHWTSAALSAEFRSALEGIAPLSL